MDKIEIKIEICREGAKLPAYARAGDAGMDVAAAAQVVIGPGETRLVPTGIKVAIPMGYELQVRPRSGISLNTPLRISNSPGTIDSGFRDEINIIMSNDSPITDQFELYSVEHRISDKGNKPGIYIIEAGDRIAQLVLAKVPAIEWEIVDSVNSEGTNRNGGFGSTGHSGHI